MKELEKLLKEKEQEILEETYPLEDKIEELRPIYEIIKSKNHKELANLTISNFVTILLDAIAPNYRDELIKINSLNNINEDVIDDLGIILESLEHAIKKINKEYGKLDFKEIGVNFNISKRIIKKQKIFENIEELNDFLKILLELYSDNLVENKFIDGMLTFSGFKELMMESKDRIQEISEESRDAKRLINNKKLIEKLFISPELNEYFKIIIKHFENMEIEHENFKRNKKRKLTQFKKIIYSLEQLLNGSFIIIKEDFYNLLNIDEDIKNVVLRIILKHNEKEFINLKEENNINKNNSISQLEKLLFEYGINPDLISSEKRILLLQNKSIEDIKGILDILKHPLYSFLNISNPYYIDILLYSNDSILKEFIDYHKKAIIREEFLQKNLNVLLPNDTNDKNNHIYYEFTENVRTLEKYRIKWNDLSTKQINITLYNPVRLKSILSSLEKYFIPFNQDSCYYFLEHPELITFIDSYIELDLYELLLDQPEDLTTKDVLKRITALTSIKNPIVNENGYIPNSILTGKNFYIANDNLDDYIVNHTEMFIDKNAKKELDNTEHFLISENIFEIDEINDLDSRFKENELIYNFNGIIISRPKVLRCFEFLSKGNYNIYNNLFSSIIYNSNLSFEDINVIKEQLFNKKTLKNS